MSGKVQTPPNPSGPHFHVAAKLPPSSPSSSAPHVVQCRPTAAQRHEAPVTPRVADQHGDDVPRGIAHPPSIAIFLVAVANVNASLPTHADAYRIINEERVFVFAHS
jgi:hypothetical protein